MKTKFLLLTASLLGTLLFSCKKNAQTPTGITYRLTTINRTATINLRPASPNGTQTATIAWTNGYAYLKQIEFEAQNDTNHVHFASESIKKIDLFLPMNSLGTISVPPGTYNQVEFQFEIQPTTTEAALELKGTYDKTPIVFIVNSSLKFDAKLLNITIAAGKAYTASSALNIGNITNGVTTEMLNAATKDASGTIIISVTSNASIYDTMVSNLRDLEGTQFE